MKITGPHSETGEGIEQGGFSSIRVAGEENSGVHSGVSQHRGAREQGCTLTWAAIRADSPMREPKTRMISVSPVLMISTRRPMQTPMD